MGVSNRSRVPPAAFLTAAMITAGWGQTPFVEYPPAAVITFTDTGIVVAVFMV